MAEGRGDVGRSGEPAIRSEGAGDCVYWMAAAALGEDSKVYRRWVGLVVEVGCCAWPSVGLQVGQTALGRKKQQVSTVLSKLARAKARIAGPLAAEGFAEVELE